ncbi:MAG: VOC family protein [Kastovskya adunca ATA6-11-RM4]|jgi:predicted enzyme related to lactoylglutathione lyase|nr:VOC family protein [Kastovskya adunca ATA6-11-RM4]
MDIRSANTRLFVSDVEACFQFYRDVMELPVMLEALKNGYAEFQFGETTLELYNREEMAHMIGTAHQPSSAECQDNVGLVVIVSDLDKAHQELTHKGVKFTMAPWNNPSYGLKTAYLRDPDGTLIGLFQLI